MHGTQKATKMLLEARFNRNGSSSYHLAIMPHVPYGALDPFSENVIRNILASQSRAFRGAVALDRPDNPDAKEHLHEQKKTHKSQLVRFWNRGGGEPGAGGQLLRGMRQDLLSTQAGLSSLYED